MLEFLQICGRIGDSRPAQRLGPLAAESRSAGAVSLGHVTWLKDSVPSLVKWDLSPDLTYATINKIAMR